MVLQVQKFEEALILNQLRQLKSKSRFPSRNMSRQQHSSSQLRDSDPQVPPSQQRMSRCLTILLWTLAIATFILILVVVIVFTPSIVRALKPLFHQIAKYPVQGYFIFFLIHALGILLFVPVFIIILAGSFSFAQALDFSTAVFITILVTSLASFVACIAAFELGRRCCRGCARKCLVERFRVIRAIDQSFISHGKKLVALMRLSGVPYEASNYILGMTSVSLADYAIGSIAYFPNIVVFVFIGSSLNDLGAIFNGTYQGSNATKVLAIVSVVVAIVLLTVMILFARHELRRITEEEERALREQEEASALISTHPQ